MIDLPANAKRRLAALAQAAADSEALSKTVPKRVLELGQTIVQKAQMRSTYEPSDSRSEELRQEIRQAEEEQERLVELSKRRKEVADNDRRIVQHVRAWLNTVPQGVQLADVEVPTPKENDLPEAIKAARDNIADLKQRLRDLKGKHLPKDELKQRAAAYVRTLASSARPVLEGTSRDKRFALAFDTKAPLPIIAAVAPALLTESLERLIDETVPSDGMPADERKKQIAELEQLLLSVEMHEEALVVEARLRGHDVLRRDRPDARALLGIEVREKQVKRKAERIALHDEVEAA